MRIVEIRNEADLAGLRSGWNALLAASASDTVFLTWEWTAAWWESYGRAGDLRVLLAFDAQDRLRGIAPLRAQTVSRYGWTFRTLTFSADGSNDSDYLDFIIESGWEQPVMEAFHMHWEAEIKEGTLFLLNEIPETSPNVALLKAMGRERGMLWKEEDTPCATVALPATWEEYLGLLRPRFRTKVRSVLRNLEGRAEASFQFCRNSEEVEQLLPVLYDLHTQRWAQEAKPGVFGWEAKRRFYERLSPLLLESGWLRFCWVGWKERLLACQYGFAYRGRYFQLQEGYDPACEHWSPGVGLRAWSLKEFLREGLTEYDFMGGIGRHKSDWGSSTKLSKRLTLARESASSLLFCHGPEWIASVRQIIKQAVPEPLLAARKVRIQEKNTAEFQAGGASQGTQPVRGHWMRTALANGYFYSPLPKLVKPLRNHFQMAITPNGTLPAVHWRKRDEASARILYYHRVNDEADPFFPAISTSLFEKEMKYLASHYKVLPLKEVLHRLSDGRTPEPMVAITFDDGYKDNHDCAWPVLRRYGLPATIFLTTGGLDSRKPLWFERLALAVKRTSREFIDWETGLPRRFWMRTEAERLDANDRIFALLRPLPDDQRRQALADVLRLLAAPEGERDGRMLSWDQVRRMKAQGIDFGGHTVTHPFLSRQSSEQVMREISECKRRIEEELQSPVEHFAYPNGREEDFGMWNKDLIRKAGYEAALTTIWGVNGPSTDPMELRRGGPWEESPAVFAAKLDWYQLVNG